MRKQNAISENHSNTAGRALALARCQQLGSIAFSHPGEAFHTDLVSGAFLQELEKNCSALDVAIPRIPIPGGGFAEFEIEYNRLFLVGNKGKPVAGLHAGDHDDLDGGQSRNETMLEYSSWYRHFGVKHRQDGPSSQLPDHIVCQFDFMAWLAWLESSGGEHGGDGRPDLSAGYSQAQKDFARMKFKPFLHSLRETLRRDKSQSPVAAFYLGLLTAAIKIQETAGRDAIQTPAFEAQVAVRAVDLWD